jgi:cytochrome c-type biogenesis protein CcmF
MALGVWVLAGAVSEIAFRAKVGSASREEVVRRLRNLPRSSWGAALAHAGVGIMTIGIVATSAWQSEKVLAMKPGDKVSVAGYELTFRGTAPSQGPNYQELTGLFAVTRGGAAVTELTPSKRLYNQPPQPTTEAGILASWRGDLYVVLGDEQKDGGYTVRVYFNPLVRLIWLGCIVMFFGGLLSLSDRRLRVGAPRASRARLQPAE